MKSTDNNKKRKLIFIGVEELISITERDPELLIGYDHLASDNILKIHDAIYDYSNIEKNIDNDHPDLNSHISNKGLTTVFAVPQNIFLNIKF